MEDLKLLVAVLALFALILSAHHWLKRRKFRIEYKAMPNIKPPWTTVEWLNYCERVHHEREMVANGMAFDWSFAIALALATWLLLVRCC